MEIVLIDDRNIQEAIEVYTISWRQSHESICSPEFLEARDYAGYLRKKLGHLYMISDGDPVGVFCLDGETFGDLYIHPKYQGRGYGTACIRFAMGQALRLRLTVLSTNTAAIALYEKVGFCFTGNDVPLRNGLWEREMEYKHPDYPGDCHASVRTGSQ